MVYEHISVRWIRYGYKWERFRFKPHEKNILLVEKQGDLMIKYKILTEDDE